MDTSERYIKMRLAAIPDLGRGTPPIYYGRERYWLVVNLDYSAWIDSKGDCYCYNHDDGECQLEHQAQLQEMCRDKVPIHLIYGFNHFCNQTLYYGEMEENKEKAKHNLYIQQFASMEQLWLAFVQKENHNKVWEGEKWVKNE